MSQFADQQTGNFPIYPCKSKAKCENNDAERTRENAANVIAFRNNGFKRAL